MWQRFFVLTPWEVFRPPQLSWTSVDLPIYKYKNIIFILPFRLMVRMLQVATEPRGLCKPGIPFCLRVVENPGVRSSQCHGCILQLFLSREGWQRGCGSWLCTSTTPPGCPHHIQSVQTTQPCCSSPGSGLGLPTETPQLQSQGHKLSHISRTGKHRRGSKSSDTPAQTWTLVPGLWVSSARCCRGSKLACEV